MKAGADVVVGCAVELLLKLNPIPLATVVSGFDMKLIVLLRFPAAPKLFAGVGAAAMISAGFGPKLMAVLAADGKLNEGAAVVVNNDATVVDAIVVADGKAAPNAGVLVVLLKLKFGIGFAGSLLASSVNPPVVTVRAGATDVVKVEAELVTSALDAIGFLAIGVNVINDLLGSNIGFAVGCTSPGVVNRARGEILPEGAGEVVTTGFAATGTGVVITLPNWKLDFGVSVVVGAVESAGLSLASIGDSENALFELIPKLGRAFACEAGVVIGAAALVVVLVVKEMEAGAESTKSFGYSFVGESNPSLRPASIIASFFFSISRR